MFHTEVTMLCTFLWTPWLCAGEPTAEANLSAEEKRLRSLEACVYKSKASLQSLLRQGTWIKMQEALEAPGSPWLFSRLGLCACYRFKQSLVSGVAVILGPRHHYWHRFAYPISSSLSLNVEAAERRQNQVAGVSEKKDCFLNHPGAIICRWCEQHWTVEQVFWLISCWCCFWLCWAK